RRSPPGGRSAARPRGPPPRERAWARGDRRPARASGRDRAGREPRRGRPRRRRGRRLRRRRARAPRRGRRPGRPGRPEARAAARREDLVAKLLEAGAAPTPILAGLGFREEHLPILRRLLAAGADPNAPLAAGRYPLMQAAIPGSAAVIRELIARGADPRRTDP